MYAKKTLHKHIAKTALAFSLTLAMMVSMFALVAFPSGAVSGYDASYNFTAYNASGVAQYSYNTLTSSIQYVTSSGWTIKMNKNVAARQGTSTSSNSNPVTLDLNGFSMTVGFDMTTAVNLTVDGTKGGSISCTNNDAIGLSAGTLTLKNVKIYSSSSNCDCIYQTGGTLASASGCTFTVSGAGKSGIYCNGGSVGDISNCTFTTSTSCNNTTVYQGAIIVVGGKTLNSVSGCTINSATSVGGNIAINCMGTINSITNCNITAGSTPSSQLSIALFINGGSVGAVSGGSFNCYTAGGLYSRGITVGGTLGSIKGASVQNFKVDGGFSASIKSGTYDQVYGSGWYPSVTGYIASGSTYAQNGNVFTVSENIAVTGVSLNTNALSLNVGGTSQLAATVLPQTATNKNVTWSTNASGVATVSNGLVKAVGNGVATITVTTADGAKTASCTVTVSTRVTGVSLDASTLALNHAQTYVLAATVLPQTATNSAVTWLSSNESVATVEGGVVYAVSAGQTTITVKTADGSYSASCLVTVSTADRDAALAALSGVIGYYNREAAKITLQANLSKPEIILFMEAVSQAEGLLAEGSNPTKQQLDSSKTALAASYKKARTAARIGAGLSYALQELAKNYIAAKDCFTADSFSTFSTAYNKAIVACDYASTTDAKGVVLYENVEAAIAALVGNNSQIEGSTEKWTTKNVVLAVSKKAEIFGTATNSSLGQGNEFQVNYKVAYVGYAQRITDETYKNSSYYQDYVSKLNDYLAFETGPLATWQEYESLRWELELLWKYMRQNAGVAGVTMQIAAGTSVSTGIGLIFQRNLNSWYNYCSSCGRYTASSLQAVSEAIQSINYYNVFVTGTDQACANTYNAIASLLVLA